MMLVEVLFPRKPRRKMDSEAQRRIELGKRIRDLRKARGFKNQEVFAAATGIKQPQISLYERGGAEPRFEQLVRIANALECTTDYLLGRSDNANPALDQLSPDEYQLIMEIRASGKKFSVKDVMRRSVEHRAKNPKLK